MREGGISLYHYLIQRTHRDSVYTKLVPILFQAMMMDGTETFYKLYGIDHATGRLPSRR